MRPEPLAAADRARAARRRRSLAVVSGAAGLGTRRTACSPRSRCRRSPRVAVAAWVAHRRLLPAVASPRSPCSASRRGDGARNPPRRSRPWPSRRRSSSCAHGRFRGATLCRSGRWRDYVTLTKPRIMSLLLLTGVCGMFVGAGGVPPLWLVAATMLGLALACGGASALNHVLDARHRPADGQAHAVAAGRRGPRPPAVRARVRARALGALVRAARRVVNVLTAVLALVGNLFYVLVYTRFLKRSTPQNIVIGGAAGAVPPLVGWAAATGDLTLPALVLFAVVFLWTPPHFWALALLIKRDYAAAGRADAAGRARRARDGTADRALHGRARRVHARPGALGAVRRSSTSSPRSRSAASSSWLAWRLRREPTPRPRGLLFHYSLRYLALLFVAMALDAVIA